MADTDSWLRRRERRLGRFLVAASLGLWLPASMLTGATTGQVVRAATGSVTGKVFQNLKQDGVMAATDPGVKGVTVRAFDSAEQLVASTVTAADGTYTLPNLTGGVRVEFSGWPAGMQPAQHGPLEGGSAATVDNGSSAQLVSAPGVANFGLIDPGGFCQNNPTLVTSCYVFADQLAGPNRDAPVVIAFPADDTQAGAGSPPSAPITHLANANQVGATFGSAVHRASHTVFEAAVIKGHVGLGPGGPMAIYAVDPAGVAAPTLFANLNVVPGAVSAPVADPHTGTVNPSGAPQYFTDAGSYQAVAKVGLGGLAVDDSDANLWAVNLSDRALVKLPLGTGPVPVAPASATRYPIPSPCKSAYASRPYSVSSHLGRLYVGGVCSGQEAAGSGDPADHANFETIDSTDYFAWVYSFDPVAGVFSSTPVLRFDLNYNHGCGVTADPTVCSNPGTSVPWQDHWYQSAAVGASGPAAMVVASIGWINNDMVLGLRNRNADQVGSNAGSPDVTDSNTYLALGNGDIIRACSDTPGHWLAEVDAASPPACGLPGFGPSLGKGDGKGLGNLGSFYFGARSMLAGNLHDKISTGGIAVLPGGAELVSTAMDIFQACSGGIIHLNNTTGDMTGALQLYGDSCHVADPTLSKANGLGTLVPVCDSAPIEIGNRVWLNPLKDGIQHGGESGIAGVRVNLLDASGAVVGTTLTSLAGTYYFGGLGNGNLSGGQRLRPYTTYRIQIDATNFNPGGPLAGLKLSTTHGSGIWSGPEQTIGDSKGLTTGGVDQIVYTTGGPGVNNHTLDFGYYRVAAFGSSPPPPSISPSAGVSTIPTSTPILPATGAGRLGEPEVASGRALTSIPIQPDSGSPAAAAAQRPKIGDGARLLGLSGLLTALLGLALSWRVRGRRRR